MPSSIVWSAVLCDRINLRNCETTKQTSSIRMKMWRWKPSDDSHRNIFSSTQLLLINFSLDEHRRLWMEHSNCEEKKKNKVSAYVEIPEYRIRRRLLDVMTRRHVTFVWAADDRHDFSPKWLALCIKDLTFSLPLWCDSACDATFAHCPVKKKTQKCEK